VAPPHSRRRLTVAACGVVLASAAVALAATGDGKALALGIGGVALLAVAALAGRESSVGPALLLLGGCVVLARPAPAVVVADAALLYGAAELVWWSTELRDGLIENRERTAMRIRQLLAIAAGGAGAAALALGAADAVAARTTAVSILGGCAAALLVLGLALLARRVQRSP
jgi:hypothetical protein